MKMILKEAKIKKVYGAPGTIKNIDRMSARKFRMVLFLKTLLEF